MLFMSHRDKASYNAYMNDYMKRRYKQRRQDAIELLGGKCVKCGSVEGLEFDHIDPATKTVTIARAASFSNQRWNEEVAKCQLLCTKHHKEKTKADRRRSTA